MSTATHTTTISTKKVKSDEKKIKIASLAAKMLAETAIVVEVRALCSLFLRDLREAIVHAEYIGDYDFMVVHLREDFDEEVQSLCPKGSKFECIKDELESIVFSAYRKVPAIRLLAVQKLPPPPPVVDVSDAMLAKIIADLRASTKEKKITA